MNWISVLDRLPSPGDLVLAWVCNFNARGKPTDICYPRIVYYSAAAGWRDAETHRSLHAEFWCRIIPPVSAHAASAPPASSPSPPR